MTQGQKETVSARAPMAVVVLRRRLEATETGALTYLMAFLSELRTLDCRICLLFVPGTSFGDIPVASVASRFRSIAEDVVWPGTIKCGPYYISTAPEVYLRFMRRATSELVRRLAGRKRHMPARASHEIQCDEILALTPVIEALNPDLVVAEYSSLAPLLRNVSLQSLRGVLLHDLFAQRSESLRAMGLRPDVVEIGLSEEIQRCGAADILIYASTADLESMQRHLPDKAHVWLRPSLPEIDWQPSLDMAPNHPPRAFFLGVKHAGNRDALDFLLTRIWPIVVNLRPSAELTIAGRISQGAGSRNRQLNGVNTVGFVPDLRSFAGPNTIALAPTRVASGVSIKVAQYLQLGMPTIASDEALTGYGSEINDLVVRAQDAEEFAQAIVDLMDNPQRRVDLSRTGCAEISKRLENDVFRDALRAMLDARV